MTRRTISAGGAIWLTGLPGHVTGQSDRVIRVGLVAPITGPDAHVGALMREGAEMAVEHLNASGGTAGRRFELVVLDDGNQPSQAVSVANRFSENVRFVVGHATSATTLPASQVYNERGMVLLAPVNAERLTQQGSPFIFRILPSNDAYAAPLADLIAEGPASADLALLHNKTDYGAGFTARLRRELTQRGIGERLLDGISPGEKDHTALIARLQAQKIRAVFLALYPGDAGLVMRQAIERGRGPHDGSLSVYGVSSLISREYFSVGGAGVAGTLVLSVAGADPRRLIGTINEDPRNAAFKDIFTRRKITIDTIDVAHVIMISAFQIIADAITRANSTDARQVAGTMRAEPFETIRGTLGFDGQGELAQPRRSMAIYQWSARGQANLVRDLG